MYCKVFYEQDQGKLFLNLWLENENIIKMRNLNEISMDFIVYDNNDPNFPVVNSLRFINELIYESDETYFNININCCNIGNGTTQLSLFDIQQLVLRDIMIYTKDREIVKFNIYNSYILNVTLVKEYYYTNRKQKSINYPIHEINIENCTVDNLNVVYDKIGIVNFKNSVVSINTGVLFKPTESDSYYNNLLLVCNDYKDSYRHWSYNVNREIFDYIFDNYKITNALYSLNNVGYSKTSDSQKSQSLHTSEIECSEEFLKLESMSLNFENSVVQIYNRVINMYTSFYGNKSFKIMYSEVRGRLNLYKIPSDYMFIDTPESRATHDKNVAFIYIDDNIFTVNNKIVNEPWAEIRTVSSW